jgi:IS5 family transposase
VDKGYKGHDVKLCQVIVSGSRRGITKALKKEMKRRSSIEPEIGHQKTDGKLGRNWLRGTLGDMMNAILCGVGANLRKILAKLRKRLYLWLLSQVFPTWKVSFTTAACRQTV